MWTPRSDPDKPDCPYLPGFEVDISTHTAPPPFGCSGTYPTESYPFRTNEWMYSVTQTKHVLTHPLLETPAPEQPSTARLIVTKSLAIGNARGAQILLCTVKPDRAGAEAFEAVAKIYDPLYYSPFTDIGGYPSDTVCEADQDYSIEAASYECLDKAGQTGSFAPAFFGSWTFSLPTTYKQETRQRDIRLILIEYIPGISMKDLFVKNGRNQIDATHLSEEYRLQVLATLLDGVVKQHHAGLDQRDSAPRNVILIPPPDLTQKPPQRVVLIDYNISTIREWSKYGKLPAQQARLPPNPMKRFWNSEPLDLAGWFPPEWSDNQGLCQEWLHREFGGEKEMLYEPIGEELKLDEPTREDLETMGYSQSHSESKSSDEGQVMPAPVMNDDEKALPISGPLFTLLKTINKAREQIQPEA